MKINFWFLRTLTVSFIGISTADLLFPDFLYTRDAGVVTFESVNKSVSEFVAEENDNKSDLCKKHIQKVLQGLEEGLKNSWAIEMLDAWGKIPAGIFYGNSAELGNFEECIGIRKDFEDEMEPLIGKYCLMVVNTSILVGQEANSVSQLPQLPVSIGTCLPKSCEASTINTFLNNFFNKTKNPLSFKDESCTIDESEKFTPWDIFAIVFFSFVGLLMLLSTIYDQVVYKLKKKTVPALLMFSVLTNGPKLFKIHESKYPKTIECLNGIRSLSIIWVVIGHAYLTHLRQNNINFINALNWMKQFPSFMILSATVSVDSFFLLSGFLVAWTVLNHLSKKGRINVLMMYVHRFLRLTPLLGAVVLFTATLLRFLGSGPFWNTRIEGTRKNCEEYWWSTLLYVQNYVNRKNMCLTHTWYLCIDTQLYILSPLILLPLWKWGKRFIWVIPILIFLSIGCVFATFINRDLTLSYIALSDRFLLTYIPTHTRYSPWLVGILFGYYMHLNKHKRIHLSKQIVFGCWLFCFAVLLAVVFGPYGRDLYLFSTVPESAFYEAFSRTSWAIALAWIIFACTQGYGGLINSFLSFPIWQVIGRLSYSIYLIHEVLQLGISASSKVSSHFSNFEVILHFWGHLGFTILISIATVLAFESPILQLEKLLFFKSNKNEERLTENVETNTTSTSTLHKNV